MSDSLVDFFKRAFTECPYDVPLASNMAEWVADWLADFDNYTELLEALDGIFRGGTVVVSRSDTGRLLTYSYLGRPLLDGESTYDEWLFPKRAPREDVES